MEIQYNTDKTINGEERNQEFFTSQVAVAFKRFEPLIRRIDVYLSDQNGIKEGRNDIRCLLEAHIEGRQPTIVTNQGDTTELAVSGAIDKLKASLETIVGRMKNH
jgi:hypothetical protein